MSRTDKDTPHHVTATTWTPWHIRCRHVSKLATARECDLPAEPNPAHYTNQYTGTCTWEPAWPRHRYDAPPRWYVDHLWTSRERRTARDDCRNAAKEHRANGDVDTIPTTRNARHCAQWMWS